MHVQGFPKLSGEYLYALKANYFTDLLRIFSFAQALFVSEKEIICEIEYSVVASVKILNLPQNAGLIIFTSDLINSKPELPKIGTVRYGALSRRR